MLTTLSLIFKSFLSIKLVAMTFISRSMNPVNNDLSRSSSFHHTHTHTFSLARRNPYESVKTTSKIKQVHHVPSSARPPHPHPPPAGLPQENRQLHIPSLLQVSYIRHRPIYIRHRPIYIRQQTGPSSRAVRGRRALRSVYHALKRMALTALTTPRPTVEDSLYP
jgi:hypothetical protein